MWPTSEEMHNLHHIYSDMTGLVVIITWERLTLFSLNRSSGNQEPFQRTVEAILQLGGISVSRWLLDNSNFGKTEGKMYRVNGQ